MFEAANACGPLPYEGRFAGEPAPPGYAAAASHFLPPPASSVGTPGGGRVSVEPATPAGSRVSVEALPQLPPLALGTGERPGPWRGTA